MKPTANITRTVVPARPVLRLIQRLPATRVGPFFFPVVTRLRAEDAVALTFDDGPDQDLSALLDPMERAGARATFFVVGRQVERHPEVLREIVSRGHAVGVHCHEHRDYLRLPSEAVIEDMHRALAVVEEVTGRPVRLFRPPYGRFSLAAWIEAGRLGWERVLWTLDPKDWNVGSSPGAVIDRVGWPRAGDVVLLHCSDRYAAPGTRRNAIGALPTILERISERGLRARSLDELLAPARTGRRPGGLASG